jgi:acyl-CoA synthetase (AMP-forming)/AMP-acid ligase II
MRDAGFLASSSSGDSPVVFDGNTGEWLTRAQLIGRVADFAEELQFSRKALGFIFAFNDAESLIAYLAAIQAGHAVAMLNPELDPVLKGRLISLFEPDFLIAPKPHETGPGYQEAEAPYASQLLLRSETPHRQAIHPDLSLLLSTSGSTGSPKLVRLSFHNLEFNARQVIQALRLTGQDRTMITGPIFNALAQSAIHTMLLCGGSFALTRARVVSREFWDTVRQSECNAIGGTPFFYQTLDRLDLNSMNVPSLRNFLQTGGHFPGHLARKFHAISQARGGELNMMYGQSEATARISGLKPEFLPEAWRSIGVALSGGRLWVENDGRECAPMEEGELFYRGANVMMGYAFGPDDLAKDDQLGGTLATGDLGYRDARGLFYITGRKSRFAKVYGWRVSLDEVEELLAHAATVAAISETDRVVICAERPVTVLADAVDELAGRLQLHRSGFEIREIDAIPRLANGKVDYRSLTQEAPKASPR